MEGNWIALTWLIIHMAMTSIISVDDVESCNHLFDCSHPPNQLIIHQRPP